MSTFKIITDSASDLTNEFMQANDIGMVSFYITADGTTYLKDRVEITAQDFFRMQREKKQFFKTSLPSVQAYIDEFNKYDPDVDILCFCISSKLSGSYQSAVNAANMLMEENPSRKIVVIDTQLASLGMAFKIQEAIVCRERGKTAEETAEILAKYTSAISIAIDDLDYLLMGGRIGRFQAFAGGLLNVKPFVKVVEGDGGLLPQCKVRGRSKVLPMLLNIIDEKVGDNPENYRIGIMNSGSEYDTELREMIEEKYNKKGEVEVVDVTLVISAHVGPGAIAICVHRNMDS